VAIVALHRDRLDVDDRTVAYFARLIAGDERDRAARFRFDRDRRRFIVRRGRLRSLLAEHVGAAPETLAFMVGPFGKPMLAGGPCFSTSHSGERMIVAIAEVELGCDIERVDETADWRPLAESVFAAGECAALRRLSGAAGRQAFFDCWARKEAFVKALGKGLSHPLDAFHVSVGRDAALLAGGEGWAIAAASPEPGYAGAVVAQDDGLPLEIRWVDRPDQARAIRSDLNNRMISTSTGRATSSASAA